MSIKIICLNIWRGELLDNALTFLLAEQPDILMLQEVTNGQDPSLPKRYRLVETLQSQLGEEYSYHFAPTLMNDCRAGKIEEGNAVFSRLPIVTQHTVFFSGVYGDYVDRPENYALCPRSLQHVMLAAGAVPLHVINFHGIWDIDGKNPSLARQKMVEAVMAETGERGHYVIGGDTNATADNPAMQPLEKNFHTVFGNTRITGFNMRRKTNPAYGYVVVDMLYTSPDIKIVSSASPDIDVSDHLPMILEIEV